MKTYLHLASAGIWAAQSAVIWVALPHLDTSAAYGVSAALLATGLTASLTFRAVGREILVPLQSVSQALHDAADGDLATPVEHSASGRLEGLLRGTERLRKRLFAVVAGVRTGVNGVAGTAAQMHQDNAALATRTAMQAGSAQATASTMEQLTVTVQQNADAAAKAAQLVADAAGQTTHAARVVAEVTAAMDHIKANSRKMSDFLGMIDGIAFQTNVLALNASVEAARVGEHGRGFAVVASEVRTLAQRAADAAREIAILAERGLQAVEQGTGCANAAGSAMEDVLHSVGQAAKLVSEISAASHEQSAGIVALNTTISQFDSTAQQNAHLVEQGAVTAEALHRQALALLNIVESFNLGAAEFGCADDAVALVRAGIAQLTRAEPQAFLDEVNKTSGGRYVDRDLYLIVIDTDSGRLCAHGSNPRLLGTDGLAAKDVDGKLFGAEIVRVALSKGTGWVDYKFPHPVTGQIEAKRSYVERGQTLAVACGFYLR